MSAHIEWLDAAATSVHVITPGQEWVGQDQHSRPVLTLANEEIVAIEGTPDDLRVLAARISTAANALHMTPVQP